MADAARVAHRISSDAEALARDAAEWLCSLAVSSTGRFAICCSGGSTPKRLYELLAEPGTAARFPWTRVHWFWGDERFVPRDHADSNCRATHEAMLSRVEVPDGNVHPVPTRLPSPELAAAEYEKTLKAFYGADGLDPARPLFDVTLLGIGEDGHTASLFPGHSALGERHRWAVPVIGVKPEARITLTFPVLGSSRDVAFLAAGKAKRPMVTRAQSGDRALPAALVQPTGRLTWFTDRAASADGGA